MAYYKKIFAFILISSTLSVNCELRIEELIGGTAAFPANYRHHVGIVGRYNNTHVYSMACSGGILSDFYILGNTECFFDSSNSLMKLRFYVIVKSVNLKHDAKDVKDVLYIYTLSKHARFHRNFVAILKLKDTLNLGTDNLLRKLKLPEKDAKFTIQARVAGYGFKSLDTRKNWIARTRVSITKTDTTLTYAYVDLLEGGICETFYTYLDSSKEMCGIMPARYLYDHRGLCDYDIGAPLVIGMDLVIAVANRHRVDCNDTLQGSLYTKVSYYLEFINGVLLDNHVEGTVIYENRMHLVPRKRKSQKAGLAEKAGEAGNSRESGEAEVAQDLIDDSYED